MDGGTASIRREFATDRRGRLAFPEAPVSTESFCLLLSADATPCCAAPQTQQSDDGKYNNQRQTAPDDDHDDSDSVSIEDQCVSQRHPLPADLIERPRVAETIGRANTDAM